MASSRSTGALSPSRASHSIRITETGIFPRTPEDHAVRQRDVFIRKKAGQDRASRDRGRGASSSRSRELRGDFYFPAPRSRPGERRRWAGCRIFAPKNELVRDEEFQFTHEPENQGWQEGDGDEKGVCDHSSRLSLGNFRSLCPTLPEAWEQGSQRRLSRSVPFVPVAAADGKYWGAKEGQSRRKSRMWRVEVGPRWPSSPWSHTSAKSPVAESRMLSASSDESLRSFPESVCSTGARCPARMALYYY